MAELRRVLTTAAPVSVGELGCGEAVVGFYQGVGWHRIRQTTREIDPATGELTMSNQPT